MLQLHLHPTNSREGRGAGEQIKIPLVTLAELPVGNTLPCKENGTPKEMKPQALPTPRTLLTSSLCYPKLYPPQWVCNSECDSCSS